MNLATQYAKALHRAKDPAVRKLREALDKRGHIKLLPQIFAEYKKLELGAERLAEYKQVTPQKEQTRLLLELYRKLTNA